jgi:hypothetical protein
MNPFLIGGAMAAILAGPRLYSMVQSGELDGTSALVRGVLVAAICSIGVMYVLRLVDGYDKEWERKTNRANLMAAIAEAEAAKKRQDEAAALAAKANEKTAANTKATRKSS